MRPSHPRLHSRPCPRRGPFLTSYGLGRHRPGGRRAIQGEPIMKIYNGMGPNPHVVRMFLAEKGVTLPLEDIDLMKGENRREPFLSVNPSGQLPALVLDDGAVIAEIIPICEYLEEQY